MDVECGCWEWVGCLVHEKERTSVMKGFGEVFEWILQGKNRLPAPGRGSGWVRFSQGDCESDPPTFVVGCQERNSGRTSGIAVVNPAVDNETTHCPSKNKRQLDEAKSFESSPSRFTSTPALYCVPFRDGVICASKSTGSRHTRALNRACVDCALLECPILPHLPMIRASGTFSGDLRLRLMESENRKIQ